MGGRDRRAAGPRPAPLCCKHNPKTKSSRLPLGGATLWPKGGGWWWGTIAPYRQRFPLHFAEIPHGNRGLSTMTVRDAFARWPWAEEDAPRRGTVFLMGRGKSRNIQGAYKVSQGLLAHLGKPIPPSLGYVFAGNYPS